MDDVRVPGKGFGKRRRVKVSRINKSGTLTRKMDYAAVKTEGAIKFRPHRSTDLLCSVFLFCQFYIRSFASFASIHCSKGIGQDCQKSRQIRFLFDESWTKVGRKLDENWTKIGRTAWNMVWKFVDRGTFPRCRERRKSITVAYDREGKPKLFDRRMAAIGKVYCLVSATSRIALVLRVLSSSVTFFSLFFSFFSFFASVASPPLLILERDNVPLCDFECLMCSLGVFPSRGLEENKVEIKTGG